MDTLSGAERIRAITDEDGRYKAFDTYPWKKDKMFMSGLYAILGDPHSENPQGTPSDLAIHARIFYYDSRIGVTIDFTKYKDWLACHPDHTPPDILPDEYKLRISADGSSAGPATANDGPNLNNPKTEADDAAATGTEPVLAWQAAAPKADLYIDRKIPPPQATEDGTPAYPEGFAGMLQMLQSGRPIPGIRQIPDTVVRDASVKPFGKRSRPKKPWEKDIPSSETEGVEHSSVVDTEFPPLDKVSSP